MSTNFVRDCLSSSIPAVSEWIKEFETHDFVRPADTPDHLEPVWKLRGALFSGKRPDGATKENIPGGSSTEEQRSQTAFSAKTLRAAGLLSVAGVGSFLTARCGALRAAKAALATAKIP